MLGVGGGGGHARAGQAARGAADRGAAWRALGFLAGLCAEQVQLTARQLERTVATAEVERARLAQQVHKATFKGYLDVQEPKSLLRGLLAA